MLSIVKKALIRGVAYYPPIVGSKVLPSVDDVQS
jgi:hypothetical protein